MRKSDVIKEIDDMISALYKKREMGLSNTVDAHCAGGIYYLRELKFKVEKMGTKKENKK